MKSPELRHILFVVGIHRSGTSALCSALHACGASFGSDLLKPMHGVNEQGFWESASVVEVNEQLLAIAGCTWYSVQPSVLQVDWSDAAYKGVREIASSLLENGFGAGSLEVIKDPRLCLTLPFWVGLCQQMGIEVSICTMWRDPGEICQSLEQRDGFPMGYSMRLVEIYGQGVASAVAPQVLFASYDSLLAKPIDLLNGLAEQLPLVVDEQKVADALDSKLRHYQGQKAGEQVAPAEPGGAFDLPSVAVDFPAEDALRELAVRFVDRGQEMTRIGDSHTLALDTLRERDDQIELHNSEFGKLFQDLERAHEESHRVGQLHSAALAMISVRDAQIGDFDKRVSDLGMQHTEALATIQERDEQIQEFDTRFAELAAEHKALSAQVERIAGPFRMIIRIPVLGRIIKAMWHRA